MIADFDRKNTDDLRAELMEAPDLKEFLSENRDSFTARSASELLKRLFLKTDLSKAELARRSGVSTVYLHQMFAGRRNPSRDRLICLAVGLSASLEDAQELLRRCGFAPLYPRERRDAIIIYALTRKMDLSGLNDELFSNGEKTLT